MFVWLKHLLRPQGPAPRTTLVDAYDLTDKGFTRALLLRATQYQDEALRDLGRVVGGPASVGQERTLREFAASSAVTIAYHITGEALGYNQRSKSFLPLQPVPADAPLVVAFALMVLAELHHQLKADGLELDFRDLAARTASLFFMAHPDEERARHALSGIEAFRSIATADHQNAREWRESLTKLVAPYVHQWTTRSRELREVDCAPLFGRLLDSLLRAAEA